jgi:hypothetical protein
MTSIDEAMERAWARKDEFERIGKLAFDKFNSTYRDSAQSDFAKKINMLING